MTQRAARVVPALAVAECPTTRYITNRILAPYAALLESRWFQGGQQGDCQKPAFIINQKRYALQRAHADHSTQGLPCVVLSEVGCSEN